MIQAIALAIILAFCAVALVEPALAQTKSITLDELDPSYAQGSRIVISGAIVGIVGPGEITIKVTRGDVFVTADQLDIGLDGTFATILNTAGGVWQAGPHTITATHTDSTRNTLTFELRGTGGVLTEDIFTANVGDGDTVDIRYAITGGRISEMEIDQNQLSMIVRIQPESAGSLTLDINREHLDARADICTGGDEEFIVLVDDVEVPYRTTREDITTRTIEITFEQTETKVQIIGTCVVPEFGAITMLILVAAIAGIVVASRRMTF